MVIQHQKSYPILNQKNFVVGEDEGNFTDHDGHGTHCAGIAAGCQYSDAYQLGKPINKVTSPEGVAPKSQLIVCRVGEDKESISQDAIIKALEHLKQLRNQGQRIDIISMSLGIPLADLSGQNERRIKNLLSELVAGEQYHTICIAAASNEGRNRDAICFPAQCGDVISIGAHDYDKERASFSAVGQRLDFLAPGVHVYGPAAAAKHDESCEYPDIKCTCGISPPHTICQISDSECTCNAGRSHKPECPGTNLRNLVCNCDNAFLHTPECKAKEAECTCGADNMHNTHALIVTDGTSSATPTVAGLIALLVQCVRKVEDGLASSNIMKRRAIMELLKEMSSHNHSADIGYGQLDPPHFLNTLNIPNWVFAEKALHQRIKNC